MFSCTMFTEVIIRVKQCLHKCLLEFKKIRKQVFIIVKQYLHNRLLELNNVYTSVD